LLTFWRFSLLGLEGLNSVLTLFPSGFHSRHHVVAGHSGSSVALLTEPQ